ncbi:NCS1 family transporter [Helcococcus bovis]|uniref:NCS1 family transporter n=1 Tax=Helcococcus bovis TaxID=3153252 RepID=UPI0038B8BC0F
MTGKNLRDKDIYEDPGPIRKDEENLEPIKPEDRPMGWVSYLMLWLGGCISIGTLAIGSAQLSNGLNFLQIFLAVTIGTSILIFCILLNDKFSYQTGSPYAIQLKSAFGTKGSIIPVMIRGLPAIVWYGYQSWLGGSVINQISITLFNYDNVWLFFLAFQLIQIILSLRGFSGISWIKNISGVVMALVMLYMLYVSITRYGDVIQSNLVNIKGTWGLPFFGAIMAFFGNSTTVMLNAGDYSRQLKVGYGFAKRGLSYIISTLPATILLGLIGAMASTATGIANPINAFSTMVNNDIMLVITLTFILFAQMSNNLTSNVLPPTYAFMDAFKLKYKPAVLIVGILAIFTFPWVLTNDSSSAGLAIFVKVYTSFFGPIFAILVTDYYILHKGNVSKEYLAELYKNDSIRKGTNWVAIIALVVGAIIGLLNVDISFFTATIPTALVYYLGTKYSKITKRFRKGTVLE